MKHSAFIKQGYLYFSSWSKKGYSIFCSLGREVKISRLALNMYRSVLLKSSEKGLVIINTDQVADWYRSFIELIDREGIIGYAKGEICPDERLHIDKII